MKRVLAGAATAAVVVAGVWVTGGVLTQDAGVAMLLTGAWFAVAGGLAVLVAWRWRRLAAAVLGSWLVTSAVVGGGLLAASTVDRVVGETVVTAADAVAEGVFVGRAHPTTGRAALVEQPGGGRVLTLTGFATDPGPDLRVYLVPGDGSSAEDALDVGALKGNKGDQQYAVPHGAPGGAVVIWCRAFSVAFGSARLG